MKKFILLFLIFFSISIFAQEADENNALLDAIVTDYNGKVRVGEKVTFQSHKTKKIIYATSDANGKFKVLLPKGDTYSVKLMSFDDEVVFSDIEVPNQAGIMSFDYQIKYQLPETYTLDDVYFDTGKATLKPSSFKSLNNLVKVLKSNKKLVIEIGGHTDNVGNPEANKILSQKRADSVKNYLISKGASATQIKTKGYGDTQPVAYNDTAEGRQKNRRTQITIISQ
jgi:outer membrane protein OmpA-like peptidoglycan-associated protein